MLEELQAKRKKDLGKVEYIPFESLPEDRTSRRADARAKSIGLVKTVWRELAKKPNEGRVFPEELFDPKIGIFPPHKKFRVFKKGDTKTVRRFQSMERDLKRYLAQLIVEGKDPMDYLIRVEMEGIMPEDVVAALDIQGARTTDQMYRIIPVYDEIRSQLMFNELIRQGDLSELVKFYTDTPKIFSDGGLAYVRVPSFDPKDSSVYEFYIKGLCFKPVNLKRHSKTLLESLVRNMFSFAPGECCPRFKHFQHYRRHKQLASAFKPSEGYSLTKPGEREYQVPVIDRKGDDMLIDQHALLGMRLVRYLARGQGLELVSSPALKADRATIGFAKALSRVWQRYRLFKTHPKTGEVTEHYRDVPLSDLEKNFYLMKFIGWRNVEENPLGSLIFRKENAIKRNDSSGAK